MYFQVCLWNFWKSLNETVHYCFVAFWLDILVWVGIEFYWEYTFYPKTKETMLWMSEMCLPIKIQRLLVCPGRSGVKWNFNTVIMVLPSTSSNSSGNFVMTFLYFLLFPLLRLITTWSYGLYYVYYKQAVFLIAFQLWTHINGRLVTVVVVTVTVVGQRK